MSTVDLLRDRLLAVDWNFGVDETREETKERIALFREFLRRSAPYVVTQGTAQAPWPFFDVAARIDPAVRAPQRELDEIMSKVPQYPATAVRNTCQFSLHFAALYDAGKAPDQSRDPFAPLVYMYELGGAFKRDGTGAIEIGIATFGVGTPSEWLDKPEPASLPVFPDLDGMWRE